MKVLVRWFVDCGRQGDLEGVFITTKEKLEWCIGKTVYFSDVLGKHSQITGEIEREEITVLSEDQDFISKLRDVFQSDKISGVHPIWNAEERIAEQEVEEE